MEHRELLVGALSVRMKRLISQNFGLEVWEGETSDGEAVIVKRSTDPASGNQAQSLVWREARILSQLDSPAFASLMAFDTVNGSPTVVSRKLPGESVADKHRREPFTIRQCLEIGIACLAALEQLHGAGILHGDLKPEHLQWTEGRVALCDFGFSRKLGINAGDDKLDGGTLRYSAPEVLGLIKGPIDASSDLFTLGLILAELLGLKASEPQRVLRDRLAPLPPIPGLPLTLMLFLDKLCRPDPHKRYRSAFAAKMDLERIRGALTGGQSDILIPLGTEDDKETLIEPALTGRDEELLRLNQSLADQVGRTIWLSAPSGRGKSYLLQTLSQQQELQGASVLWARAVTPRGGARLPLWSELANSLGDWVRSRPDTMQALQIELSSPEQSRLSHAFPAWDFLGRGPEPDGLPQETLQEALSNMLAISSRNHRLVLFFDDVQWADSFTLRFLQRSQSGVSIVAAFRSEELFDELQAAVGQDSPVALPHLSVDASRELLFSMSGPLPDDVWKTLQERSQGEPLLLQSLLRGAVENAALQRKDGAWRWRADVAADLQVDRRGGWMISDRVKRVSAAARQLLNVGAVLGKTFSLSMASLLSGCDEKSLTEAAERHLVWVTDDRATFTHDKIREALLATVNDEDQAALHARAAEHLEKDEAASARDIALHWSAAQQSTKALPFAIAAAEEASLRFDYSTARNLWLLADQGLNDQHGFAAHRQVSVGLARSTFLGGYNEQATELYRKALRFEDVPGRRAELIAELISVLSKNCEFESVMAWAEQGLSLLGIKVPTGHTLPLAAAKEAARFSRLIGQSRPTTSDASSKTAGKLLHYLAEASLRTLNQFLLLWAATRACIELYAEDAPSEAAVAFGFLSMAAGSVGLGKTRLILNELAHAHAGRHPQFSGQVRGMSGVLPLQNGDVETALARFTSAIPLCTAYGDRWNYQVCGMHRCFALNALGRFEEARPELRQILFSNKSTDSSVRLACALLLALSGEAEAVQDWAANGIPSFEGTLFEMTYFLLLGSLALRQQAWASAADFFRQATKVFTPTASFHSAGPAAWLALTYRMIAEALPHEATSVRVKILSQASRAAETAYKHTKRWPTLKPHALREQAINAALAGRWFRARALFSESTRLAEKFGMAFEAGWTLYERGRFAAAAGWTDWLDDQAEGLARVRRLGGWIPGVDLTVHEPEKHLAKLDRFDRVLEAGRRLVALEGKDEEVLSTLQMEAKALLRCDRIDFVSDGDPLPDGWSETLHQQCLEQGHAVTEAQVDEPSRSLLLHEARSTLMSPLRVEGGHVGVLIAWQKTIGGFFGEEETRLADYLCTLAGGGLENARILSERDQTFAALRTSEQRFRGFFEYAGVGTALLDEQGQTTQENPYLTQLLGQSTVGKSPWQYCHASDREQLKSSFASLQRDAVSRINAEIRLHRAGGEVAWTQVCLVKLPVREEDRTRFLLTVADTTHRRIAEMMNFLENERRGLAAEVHDELAQNIGALHLMLAQLKGSDTNLAQAKELAKQLVRDASELIGALRNPLAEGVDLLSALKELVARFSIETEIEVKVTWPNTPTRLSDLCALVVYRVVQEALVNIRKHAQAGRVQLAFEQGVRHFDVAIQDDGLGFDAEAWLQRTQPVQRFGFISMRDRVEMAGGRLELQSELNAGTRLSAELPTITAK